MAAAVAASLAFAGSAWAVTLSTPGNGSATQDTTPNFSGTALTGGSGGSQTITVKVWSGSTTSGTPLRTFTTQRNSSSWSVDYPVTLAQGTYTGRAEQVVNGNTQLSSANGFRVDQTAPAVTITSPASPRTNDNTPALGGAAGSATGDSSTVTVRVYAGSTATGTPVQTLTPTRSGSSWSATATTLGDGTYTATANQTDDSGHSTTTSGRTFTVDTLAPAVTLTSPSPGARTADNTPTLSGAAGAATGDSSAVTVRIYAGSTATGTPVQTLNLTRSGTSWSGTAATLGDGTYTATATQLDDVLNSATTPGVTFTVDTAGPAGLAISTPVASARTNSATPTISGTAGNATGDSNTVTVRVYAGATATGTPVQTLSLTRSGTAWSGVPTSLPDGTYTAQANQLDDLTNSTTTVGRTFTVDRTAPSVSLTAPANGSRTNDNTPTLSGAAGNATGDSSSVTVKVYAGATATGTPVQTLTPTRSGTAWSATATTLGDGQYTAQATQADDVGNSANSSSTTFTVDTTGPGVTVTTPSAGSRTNDNTPSLAGAAGNVAGDSATVTVKVFAGGTATGTPVQTIPVTRSGGSWSTTATTLANGTYTVQATQTDDQGNSTSTAGTTFTVDTAAPTVTLTTPTAGLRTNDNTPSLAGAAGSATGDSSTVTVKVYAGGTATGTPVQTIPLTRSGGSWSTSASTLADGTYTATATQADDVGNSTTTSATTFTVDTAPPGVSVTTPTAGSRTNDNTPSLAGAAGSATGDSTAVTVKVFAGATATGTPVQTLNLTRSGASWSGTATTLADGTYTVQATQADDLGNTASTSGTTFTVDTAGPGVTVTAPTAGSRTGDNTPTLAGGAGNATGDSSTVTVKVFAGPTPTGTPVQTLTPTRSAASWSTTATTLADGQYTVQATQVDDQGNSTSTSGTTFTVDTAAPGVTLTTPTAALRTSDNTPSLGGAAGAAAGDSGTVTVRVYAGATATGSPVQTLNLTRSGATWSGTATTLADGTYTATATQADDVGNSSTTSGRTFTVDTTGPAVTVTNPGAGGRTGDSTPAVSGAAGSATGDSTAVTVKIYAGPTATGTALQTLDLTRSGGTWTGVATALGDGQYTVQATQVDDLGNTTTTTGSTFTVDTTAPAVGLSAPADGARTGDNTPSVSGAAGSATGDSSSVSVKVYSGSTATGTPVQQFNLTRSGGSWSGSSPALSDGTYTVTAVQADDVGNSATTTGHTFTVDTAAPAPTVGTPAAGTRTGDTTPSLGGASGNAAGDDAAVTVKIFSGPTATGTPVQTITATRSGPTWADAAGALADGTYTVTATQADDVGNSGTSSPVTFVVDTSVPAVTVTAPAHGSRTKNGSPALSGAAGNAAGDADTVTVKLFSGGTASGAALQTHTVTRTAATWSDTLDAALADGTYTVQATQRDDVDNVSTAESTFVVDSAGPALTIATPADAGATSDTTPAANGVAGNAGGDDATIALKVFSGPTATGSPVQTFTATRSGPAWNAAIAALAPGTYTLEATQGDDLGNSTTVTSTFRVDTTAPAVALTDPADGSSSTETAPTFGGTSDDSSIPVSVRVYSGADVVRTLSAAVTSGAWSVKALPALPPGSYTVQASQTDAAGNTGTSATRGFTVTRPQSATGTITPVIVPPSSDPPKSDPPALKPALLSPFPIVRIVGVITSKGVKLSLLSVRGPAGASVDVRCSGRGCPFKHKISKVGQKSRTVKISKMANRTLRPGVTIVVRVIQSGRVGKFTRFRIRKGKPPTRLDTCAMANDLNPVRCPS